MIKETIAKLLEKKNLNKEEAHGVMNEIMQGQATSSQIAGFLISLRVKGETPDEIAGCAVAMRNAANKMAIESSMVVDNCGTGGDGTGSLNISTAAAFVVAGAGWTVAKHGNRSISSKCGSADVLEAMGVNINALSATVEQCINKIGIGFIFAPHFHPAMKYAMPTRKELGVRTVFNVLGPLTNPARAKVQLIGVFKPELTKTMAAVLQKMGHKGGLVAHSHGWDEITLDGPTHVTELVNNKIKSYKLHPKDFGLPKVPSKKLMGGDAQINSKILFKIFSGDDVPARHVVVANAAALIWIAERAYKKSKMSLKEAVKQAEESLDKGKAYTKFKAMAEESHMLN